MRSVLFLLLALSLLAPTPAVAEEEIQATWVLVVDEGASRGDEDNQALRRTALDLAKAVRRRGHVVLLLAAGAKKDGTPVVAGLRRTAKAADRSARLTNWAKEVKEAKFHGDGLASPQAALKGVLARHEEDGPLTVVFLGAFTPPPADEEEPAEDEESESEPEQDVRAEADAEGVKAWTDDAPTGSRVMALAGLAPRSYEVLRELPKFVADGFVILEAGAYDAQTYPYSPLPELVGRPGERQSAEGELQLTTLALAPSEKPDAWAPLQEVLDFVFEKTNGNKDLEFLEPRQGRLTLSRGVLSGPSLELEFAWKETGKRPAIPLCDPPSPLTLKWLELRPDAQLVLPPGKQHIRIVATIIDATHEQAFQILRTVSDPERRWWWHPEAGAPTTQLPTGLTVEEQEAPVEENGPGRKLIRNIRIRVRFQAKPGVHVQQWKGKLAYTPRNSKLDALKVPVSVSTKAPRVELESGSNAAALILPRAQDEAGMPLRVKSGAQRGPATVQIELAATAVTGKLPQLTWRVRSKDGESAPQAGASARLEVPVDMDLELLVDLAAGSAPINVQGNVRVTVAKQGDLESTGTLTGAFRTRQPRLRLAELRPDLRVEDGALVSDPPLRIKLDADGGDGAWLLARMRTAPVVRGQLGDQSPTQWIVENEAPGVWRARPEGPWGGTTPGAFEDQEEALHMEITWADGPAPGAFDLVVLIPARWGVRGWLFVGLAVLALALATFTVLQLRSPPITGTLLYTSEGLERTVGRLDLAPVGRKTMILRADKQGRLSVGSKSAGNRAGGSRAAGSQGDAIAVLRPTRVAGTIEIPSDDGRPQKRLLVDGLTVRVGTHALRYLSGQPTDEDMAKPLIDVPDLLGPEFDVGSGRFDAEVPRIGGGDPPAGETPAN